MNFRIDKRDALDALRRAIQAAAAASAFYGVMKWAGLPEIFVGVLSAVLIVEPTAGHTMGAAFDRVLAALFGTLVGCLCIWLLPYGVGSAIALGVTMMAVNAVAHFRPEWSYGVVAAVAIALQSEEQAFQTATDRMTSIGIGALVGTIVSLVVWPERARSRAERHVADALVAACDRFNQAIVPVMGAKDDEDEEQRAAQRFGTHLGAARAAAQASKIAKTRPLLRQIDDVERFYNSVLIVRRATARTKQGDIPQDEGERACHVVNSACSIAQSFAKGETHLKQEVRELSEQVNEISAASASDRHTRRNGLAFGLEEIAMSLSSLIHHREGIEDDAHEPTHVDSKKKAGFVPSST